VRDTRKRRREGGESGGAYLRQQEAEAAKRGVWGLGGEEAEARVVSCDSCRAGACVGYLKATGTVMTNTS
jgi:hypothetical protein